MAFDASDDIAFVALIVSLVALFVAFLQFFQATFTTAEGGRRCKRSVMGEWSTLTKWTWNWSEFRFEVKYVTPEIRILTHDSSEIDNDRIPPHKNQPLNSLSLRKPYLLDFAHLPGNLEAKFFSLDELREKLEPIEDSIEKFAPGRSASRMTSLIESSKLVLRDRQAEEEAASGVTFVSWYSLLYRLHLIEYLTHHMETMCQEQEQMRLDILHQPVQQFFPFDTRRTSVAVFLRRYSWDLMPPDIVRPLALTRLGDILVLAQRLGMHWRSIDLKSGLLHAEGDGCTISATTVRGLGLVATYQRTASDTGHWTRPFIPCKEVDMMLCGVLPLDKKIMSTEHGLGRCEIVDEHKGISGMGTLFSRLHCHPATDLAWKEPSSLTAMIMNDAIAMTAPFMVLKNSPLKDIPALLTFPGSGDSIMASWCGRETLRQRLLARSQTKASLIAVANQFGKLRDLSVDDFYCRYDSPGCLISSKIEISTTPSALTRRVQFLDGLRAEFDQISDNLSLLWKVRSCPIERLVGWHLDVMMLRVVCGITDESEQSMSSIRKLLQEGHRTRQYDEEEVRSWVTVVSQQQTPFQMKPPTARLDTSSPVKDADDAAIARANLYADAIEAASTRFHSSSGADPYDVERYWWLLVIRALCWRMAHWTRPHAVE